MPSSKVALAILAFSSLLPLAGRLVITPDLNPTSNGLSASDWSSIRREYERNRHAAVPVAGGYRARNHAQQWLTNFDGRGFTVQPDSGQWTWGLELERYGLAGQEHVVSGRSRVVTDKERVSYDRGVVEEWFVNDGRGLEYGFTLRERPLGTGGPLRMHLKVRGELSPRVAQDGRGVNFVNAAGQAIVIYAGLKVWDAGGKVLPARFEPAAEGNGLRLAVEEVGARYPLTIDPIAQQAYLKASNTRAHDIFGASVAVSGDTVVVGSPGEDSNARGVNGDQTNDRASRSGAAYVFVRSGGGWSQQAYLKASNTGAGHRFGDSVSVSGDTVVVGSPVEDSNATGVNGDQTNDSALDSGAAYIFVRSGSTWSQQAYLKASNTGAGDNFGHSVGVSGDTVVVAAVYESSNATGVNGNQANNNADAAGAAYIFVRSRGAWRQQAYLKASNTEALDTFGTSVAVSGDTVVVGAQREASSATGVNGDQTNNNAHFAGAAYVFVRSGGVWSQQAYLKASNAGFRGNFGVSVASSGDTVVVGAHGEAIAGAAYVFVRNGGAWSEQAYLKASNPEFFDTFGISVAVFGDTVLVGAPYEDGNATGVNGDQTNNGTNNSGAAYVFVRSGGAWRQEAYVKASNTGFDDYFGHSVTVSGGLVVVGATYEDSNATGVNRNQSDNSADRAGAAYVFTLPPAPDITGQFNITRSVVTFNRATGRYTQTVMLTNRGPALSSAAYVTDNLPIGVAMLMASGTTGAALPAGRPYKELGAIAAGATVTVAIEFTRTGTPPIVYMPRILGEGPR